MKHTETELLELKKQISQMWELVQTQLKNSKEALLNTDLDLAVKVTSNEKRVNAFELKIDSDCENYIALFSPVAIDLRLVLSILKINKTLERIGDFAEGIARFVLTSEDNELKHKELIVNLKIEQMMQLVEDMLDKAFSALTEENTAQANVVFSTDRRIDTLYDEAVDQLVEYVRKNVEEARYVLQLLTVLRKIERCGDHCDNIMEEIVFYLDAKVVKHQSLNKT